LRWSQTVLDLAVRVAEYTLVIALLYRDDPADPARLPTLRYQVPVAEVHAARRPPDKATKTKYYRAKTGVIAVGRYCARKAERE